MIAAFSRLRADPALVRVSIRRYPGGWWSVCIKARENPSAHPIIGVNDPCPAEALVIALDIAAEKKLPGIDIDMDRAYPHPQYTPPSWRVPPP